MSTHVSPYTQTVNGYPTDTRLSDHPGTTNYQDLVLNSDLFWQNLQAFHKSSGKKFKIPTVGGNALDLHRLFVEVTSRGGIERVTKERKWKDVIAAFNFPTTITSAAFVLRKYYISLLYRIEQMCNLNENVSPASSTDEACRSIVKGSAFPEEGNSEAYVGCSVNGVIDGKFDNGYLVTMKFGSEELQGVLYHIPQAPYQSQNSDALVETSRRHKKRSRSGLSDSRRPKCHRSGYNFFFSEQYALLKTEYSGQERALTKRIGQMWSSMSESEKQVYQEKGMKDVERYRSEMSEYKSSYEAVAAP